MRKEGWEGILADYLDSSRGISFKWGESDCALWVGKYYAAVTGADLTVDWVGKYLDEEGANEALLEAGFVSACEIVDTYLSPRNKKFAMRGDIVMFNGALGICDGRRSYIITQEKGMFAIPTSKCEKVWAV